MSEEQRVALVSGANRGIGRETARQLAMASLRVIVGARDAEAAQTTAAELAEATGSEVHGQVLDVTSNESVAAVRAWTDQRFGGVDVLVNNAGVLLDPGWGGRDGSPSVFDAEVDVLRRSMDVNLYGVLRLSQAFIPGMVERGWGRVVNISSGMGQLSEMSGLFPGYRLSKAALNALTCMLEDETKRYVNVKINAVCPGWVRTDMGGENAARSVEEGARGVVWAATLADDGPSGGFFRDGEPLDW